MLHKFKMSHSDNILCQYELFSIILLIFSVLALITCLHTCSIPNLSLHGITFEVLNITLLRILRICYAYSVYPFLLGDIGVQAGNIH